jgi:hypothetical protein
MDRFIVGTGRCGSTLLSRMLAHNTKVLSITEFWSVFDRAAVFSEGEYSGQQAASLALRQNFLNELVITRSPYLDADNTGHSMRKEVGKFAPTAFGAEGLRLMTSRFLEECPTLFEEVLSQLETQPRQTLAAHWRGLWEFMARRLGREVWLERSGVSIEHVDRLIAGYPEARFIHLHRDGLTNALGVRAFRHFVLYTSFFFDPPSDDEITAMFECEVGSKDDPVMRRMGPDMPPLAAFGDYWSWQVVRGQSALMQLPQDRWTKVSYEHMVAAPEATLARIADFFDLPDDGDWIARAATEIDTDIIPDRVSQLARDELLKLRAACRPGMSILGRDRSNPFEDAMHSVRRVFDSRTLGNTIAGQLFKGDLH